jgi:DNA-directed RNA polymerase specialized sigma24 family protein
LYPVAIFDLEAIMQSTIPLNGLFADYSAGLLEKRELEGEIFKAIKEDMRRLSNWNRADNDDYLSWLYPRISHAIGAYRETGSSFETYIGSLVRMTAKEYHSRKVRSYLTESAALMSISLDMYTHDDSPEYARVEEAAGPRKCNPRQLLILILKCCCYVSDDFLERASPILGIQPEKLNDMVSSLRKQGEKRELCNEYLQERVNYQFCRCIFYEKRLKSLPENCIAAQRTRDKLERGRERLARLRKRLAKRLPDPSNVQIARLLGISKGTVDSVLYRLKFLNNKDNEIILN